MTPRREGDVVPIAAADRSRAARAASSVRSGQALGEGARVDCFELGEVLGSGSFGITYKAYDHELERPVAIKEYFPRGLAVRAANGVAVEPSGSGEAEDYGFGLRRFINEARALAQFAEPNIVRVLRYLEANGTGYLVMNLEEGRSLGQVMRRVSRLNERQVRALAVHLLRGLDAVHRKDFLHRDVKPANILVRASGPPILLDFGAARLALEQQRTGALTVTLTPGYAPIEQYGRYEEQGPWTDIYGLGATLYHCMMKASPANATDRLVAMRDEMPDPVSVALDGLVEHYSADLCGLIEWMLKPRAAERPRRARDVLDMLGGATTAAQPPTLAQSPSLARQTLVPPATKTGLNTYDTLPGMTTLGGTSLSGTTIDGLDGGGTRRTRGGSLGGTAPRSYGNPSLAPAPPPVAAVQRPVEIAPDVVAYAKRELTDILGPIASVLVAQAVKNCQGESQFFDLLAEELDTAAERNAFYESCATVSRAAIRSGRI